VEHGTFQQEQRQNMSDNTSNSPPRPEPSYLDSSEVRLGFHLFKWGVYFLLALNVYFFYVKTTAFEALDSFGWLMLVAVMEYETRTLDRAYSNNFEKLLIGAIQIIAYMIIIRSWYLYYAEGMWMDFVNATAWLLVCALLVYDVYTAGHFNPDEWKWRNMAKGALYAILLGCAVYWGVTGDVLNFYDAFLWILAFVVIELNVFGFEKPKVEAPQAT
jgi:hypothetical protein